MHRCVHDGVDRPRLRRRHARRAVAERARPDGPQLLLPLLHGRLHAVGHLARARAARGAPPTPCTSTRRAAACAADSSPCAWHRYDLFKGFSYINPLFHVVSANIYQALSPLDTGCPAVAHPGECASFERLLEMEEIQYVPPLQSQAVSVGVRATHSALPHRALPAGALLIYITVSLICCTRACRTCGYRSACCSSSPPACGSASGRCARRKSRATRLAAGIDASRSPRRQRHRTPTWVHAFDPSELHI